MPRKGRWTWLYDVKSVISASRRRQGPALRCVESVDPAICTACADSCGSAVSKVSAKPADRRRRRLHSQPPAHGATAPSRAAPEQLPSGGAEQKRGLGARVNSEQTAQNGKSVGLRRQCLIHGAGANPINNPQTKAMASNKL